MSRQQLRQFLRDFNCALGLHDWEKTGLSYVLGLVERHQERCSNCSAMQYANGEYRLAPELYPWPNHPPAGHPREA